MLDAFASRTPGTSALAALIVVLFGWPGPAKADSLAPPSLRGKSVRLGWTEDWTTRGVESGHIGHSHNNVTVLIYFSSEGHIFSRRNLDQKFGRSGRREASNQVEAVGDDAGQSKINSFGSFEFNESEMRAYRRSGSGTAVQLAVKFDSSFSSCEASVHHASDGSSRTFRGPATGKLFENMGVSVGGVSCSVQSGNVFGN